MASATRLLKRAAALAAGVVLGVAIMAGAGLWQSRAARPQADPTPAPVHREPAPDPRG